MAFLRKRTPGSMFKRMFIMMTVSVLFCITVAALILLLFFVNIWKNDRLAHLSADALSLAQGAASLYDETAGETGDFDISGYFLFAVGSMQSMAESEGAEFFFVSPSGNVILCSDCEIGGTGNSIGPEPCARHRSLIFDARILDAALKKQPTAYYYEGPIADVQTVPAGKDADQQIFLSVAPLYDRGRLLCFVISMQPVISAYLPYTTEFVRMLISTGLLAVLISFVLSLIVSYRMVKPLKSITAATKKYAGGDFSQKIEASDHYKELSELIVSFNSMAESLAMIDESRSSFVANISHELKTPMTIISGFIDGILDQTIPPEDTEKYLRIVSDETKRLSRLVVAMLNMSKIEAGKLTLKYSDVPLRSVVIQTLVGFEKAIEEKKIGILGLSELEDVHIRADEALFNQIVYNLIDNAVKFTPEGGEISVSLTAEKKTAVMVIRNTGRGIPPEACALIFDRFYKVDTSRGLDSKSFGMGLYIVKSIIELHQGTISVSSEPDRYTAFEIRLPMDRA